MYKILSILFLGLTFIILSCEKEFEHTNPIEVNSDTACHLCNYADSLEGTYRGVVSYYPWQPSNDTINIDVEHIFLSFGNHKDSTLMIFHFLQELIPAAAGYDSFTASIDNNSGIFYETPIGDRLTIIGDSLHYVDYFVGIEDTILRYKFDGKKIP